MRTAWSVKRTGRRVQAIVSLPADETAATTGVRRQPEAGFLGTRSGVAAGGPGNVPQPEDPNRMSPAWYTSLSDRLRKPI